MTAILSWNVQNGRGVDGVVSLTRIAEVIDAMGTPDVICLQEVSKGLELAGAGVPDQPTELAALFPGYEFIFGIAVDTDPEAEGQRWQFGNALLSRLPVVSIQHHALPRTPVAGVRHMARQATEVVVETANGTLRIINTHLEFHSTEQRAAQVARIRSILGDASGHADLPPLTSTEGPYREPPAPNGSVICGDFNMEADSTEYRHMCKPAAFGPIADAWECTRPRQPHDPTCGVHDQQQWPQGPHCRDFFFLTGSAIETARTVIVDVVTEASDHQPLFLDLSD